MKKVVYLKFDKNNRLGSGMEIKNKPHIEHVRVLKSTMLNIKTPVF